MGRMAGLGALAAALAVAALLWRVQPLPTGHAYILGVEVAAALFVVWWAWTLPERWSHSRLALGVVAAVGVLWSAENLTDVRPDTEVVRVYGSLFSALDAGRNPYACDCIVHFSDHGARLGNFNYLPTEIWPYRAATELAGEWSVQVLVATLLLFGVAAFAVLWGATARDGRLRLLAFAPWIVLWELRTNVQTTLLVVALVVAVLLQRQRHERPWQRPALWVLFGVGMLTKFAVIPLFATWWWHSTYRRYRAARVGAPPRPLVRASLADAAVPAGIAVALSLPFGLVNIVRETVLFNLELGERAELTTFYPNVLSGLLQWVGASELFPVAAVGAMVAAVLLSARHAPVLAMLLTLTVFMLVAPTPEPQYLPVVILMFVAAVLERESLAVEARDLERQAA